MIGSREDSSVLALDYGGRRLGIATGNTASRTATPRGFIEAQDGEPDWSALDRLIEEWQPDILVIGLPYNKDGTESEMTHRVMAFTKKIEQRYRLPVATVDERLTSREARSILREQRRSGARQRRVRAGDVDSAAATLIAETWLKNANGVEGQ